MIGSSRRQFSRIAWAVIPFLLAILVIFPFSARPEAREDLSVFVIAIDGLRADKLQSIHTPVIDELIAAGAYCPAARATIPTATRVNFVTLATGTHADKHGIVGSAYRDRDWRYQRTDLRNYRLAADRLPVPTVFEILEANGVKTAFLSMKGYELVGARGASVRVEIQEHVPESVWANRYEEEIDGSEEKSFHSMLSLNLAMSGKMTRAVEEQDVRFFIANLASTDYIGHQFGPESTYYELGVMQADRLIGEFLETLERLGRRGNSAVIIVSDHGFTQVRNPDNVIRSERGQPDIPELGDAGIEHSSMGRGGMAVSVFIRDQARVREAFSILRELPWVANIHTEHPIPDRDGSLSQLRLNTYRAGDFFIDVSPDYTAGFPNRGQHGSTYDTCVLVPIVLSGAGVSPGVILEEGANVDVAPTVLALFGLDPERHLQADGRVLSEALAEAEKPEPAAVE